MEKQIRARDPRRVARAITWIENGDPRRYPLMESLFPHTGHAHLIGLTGAPGAGKSSLADALITHLRHAGLTVGVLAVDPTSPFTGGSLLGDRIRMNRHALDEGVFIRSMGTRGSLGGLARATKEAARVLDAAGYDVILVETVGVGQSEIDIMHMVDTVALILTPGAGDTVQVFKAGIMEIADLFIVNKADLPGKGKLIAQLEELIHIAMNGRDWTPSITPVVSTSGEGMESLWERLKQHRHYLFTSGLGMERRRAHLKREVQEIMRNQLQIALAQKIETPPFQADLDQVQEREIAPHRVAHKWLQQLLEYEGEKRIDG
ncbi:methylmalonyl Co-A mutase-associated GTPase MeaB [Mechercharimyces sp. CAU 1602]|uniref:methylmalonyl Co-A mutase-associated GTPase MeaB n=1 Tax=Mechercharimyces sp. CAU 1602 TaxID=2973933 RepID=UPI002161892C|nr:methylmalonyl Co-A mutase-associated GTPase MeaB [Mechercharimyces sp. CAU 1602]MCS1352347.1 methylmalonyl Co-A mutase-associated GTPase MeaB [Mechercharimyces sp. CAU 1602]